MSHEAQRDLVSLVKSHLPQFFEGTSVLEVGSLDINGSVRPFFKDCDFTGIDVDEGPGVDRVVSGEMADFPTGAFDVTISCECFEHNPWWRETLANMLRMTRPGGLVLMTCAGPGRPEHGTTRTDPTKSPFTVVWDYYANVSPKDLKASLPLERWMGESILGSNWDCHDTHLIGVRGPDTGLLGDLRNDIQALSRTETRQARLNWLSWHLGGEFGSGVVRNLRRRLA